MKKITIILTLALMATTWTASAQKKHTVFVWQDGEKTTIAGVDSITFAIPTASTDTDYVDMGLSVKWAKYNLGATKPEEAGDHYAWGETETKSNYTWATYKHGDRSGMNKYSDTDGKTKLDDEDDVARAKLGSPYRLPTNAELQELVSNCTWKWTAVNGMNGYEVTSNINGNVIFFPTAGDYDGESYEDVGSMGGYWTSERPSTDTEAYYLFFGHYTKPSSSTDYRFAGWSVRPVCPL